MNRYFFCIIVLLFTRITYAQTNTFPANGSVGIGTLNPIQKLEVIGNIRLNSQSRQLSGDIDVLEFAKCHELGCYAGPYVQGNITSYTANGYAGGLKFYTGYHTGNGNYALKPAMTIGATSGNINDAYVGIGTTSPNAKLHVYGGNLLVNGGQGDANSGIRIVAPVATSHYNWMIGANQNVNATFEITPSATVGGTTFTSPAVTVNANGNVGIGTSSPASKLDVSGAIYARYDATVLSTISTNASGTLNVNGWNNVNIQTGGNSSVYASGNGNVGIGTTSPSEKLSVNGNIRTKKLIVAQTNWPDYVFHPAYQLKPLDEVEKFVQVNRHLPGVPSQKEVDRQGLDVGDTQALLLKKIEELTLYMIEVKKENKVLQEQINKQAEEIRQIKQVKTIK